MKISPFTRNVGSIIDQYPTIHLNPHEKDFILSLLQERGFILFTNSGMSLEESELFCKQFGDTTGYKNVFTDIPELGFHSEFAFMPFSPELIWFYCQEPALSGGETKICDGIQVLDEMDKDIRELFYKKPIQYNMQFSAKDWRELFNVKTLDDLRILFNKTDPMQFSYKLDDDENLYFQYTTSAIRVSKLRGVDTFINTIIHSKKRSRYGICFADGTIIPEPVIDELITLTNKLTVLLKWKKNEFVMIDNTRVMHGRAHYCDNRRLIKSLHTKTIFE